VALECITVCLSTRCGSWPTLEAPTAMFPLHLRPTSISPRGWGRKTDRLLCKSRTEGYGDKTAW